MSTEEWSVYKHTSPNGKIYIGVTHQKPEYRWRNGEGYKSNTHFYNAIQKYGWSDITHEIIADGLIESDALALEKELVEKYKSSDRRYGYNIAEGGHVLSDESRKKIGNTRKLRKIPSPTTGKHLSAETRAKISESNKGNKCHTEWTEEQKERVRKSKRGSKNPNYGKPMPEEKLKALVELNSKPVIKIEGDTFIHFKSAKRAQACTGIACCNITRVCKGQRMTAGGYVWMYAD